MNTVRLWNPHDYGHRAAELLVGERLPDLGPGRPDASVKQRLVELTVEGLFAPQTVSDRVRAECCLAGIWLWFDFLDESHAISQGISSVDGSYWHGLMHRREPDYPNAKYWFHRVPNHPVFAALPAVARLFASARPTPDVAAAWLASAVRWDPDRFIDCCESASGSGSETELLCREIARAEWQLLFDHCYRSAIGG